MWRHRSQLGEGGGGAVANGSGMGTTGAYNKVSRGWDNNLRRELYTRKLCGLGLKYSTIHKALYSNHVRLTGDGVRPTVDPR